MLTLDRVGFQYDESGPRVLDDISLTVRERDIVSLAGPSGGGKTTILSIIAGLLVPGHGQVTWEGESEHSHLVTMMFQKDTLLPWLNVEQNVNLHFRLTRSLRSNSRPSRVAQRERVRELIALAGLEGAEAKYPYQLSGGMRRRVALLAAVAPLPRLLLLDEPFSALDEPTRVSVHQDMYDIVRRYGITVIMATHDLGEAISLSDEVVILTRPPTRLAKTYKVDVGIDRDMLTVREMPEFLSLYGELWDRLSMEIRRDAGPRSEQSKGLAGAR